MAHFQILKAFSQLGHYWNIFRSVIGVAPTFCTATELGVIYMIGEYLFLEYKK